MKQKKIILFLYGYSNLLFTLIFVEFGKNGRAEQSTTYHVYVASKAIDGNRSQIFRDGSCSHTATDVQTAWWRLDLGKKVMIHNIVIYYRDDFASRLDGFYLYISDAFNPVTPQSGQLCYHDKEVGHPNITQNKTCNIAGQNVVIYNNRTSPHQAILELCEVEVYGCNIGFYRYNCDKRCSVNCVNNLCDVWNGSCPCKPGYTGDRCERQCVSPRFGKNCQGTCHCLEGDQCDHVNGKCPHGCSPGWKQENCSKECNYGRFGKGCEYACHCLNGSPCDHVNGYCSNGCSAGWKHTNCSEECDHGKFGLNCQQNCHCLHGVPCNFETGVCPFTKCEPGWKHSNCSEECGDGTFGEACASVCHCLIGARCDNINGLCPNRDCKAGWKPATCSKECAVLTFGINCQNTCHCLNGTSCDRFTGFCPNGSCDKGWNGSSCSERCPQGTYGYNCVEKCTNCLHTCDAEDGTCKSSSEEATQDYKSDAQKWKTLAMTFIGLLIATMCTSVLATALYCRQKAENKSHLSSVLPEFKVERDQIDLYDIVADVEMTDANKTFTGNANYASSMSIQTTTGSDEVQQHNVYQELLETKDNCDHVYN